jgi:alpha-beta hydrolase superfamily lysophospholipase
MMVVATVAFAGQAAPSPQAAAVPGMNAVTIRGQQQEVHYYPAKGRPLHLKILFAPGDGGWRGWAVTIAETMSAWGYDVYGFDTKIYLDGFTRTAIHVTELNVAQDLREIAEWMTHRSGEKVTLVGWSEGAGLCVLGAAGNGNKNVFAGLVAFGLGDDNVLAWHWSNNITSLVKKPKEPSFKAADYMPKLAPLPLLMIQASRDQYTSVDEANRLFALAQEPKRFVLVEAQNHRFDGNQDEFFRKLRDGLSWTTSTSVR